MDQQVIEFFDKNRGIEHNKDVLMPPAELLESTEQYFQWLRHNSKCKSLRLDINVDVTEIQEELKSLAPLAIPHRGHTGWCSITLYGYSSIMTNSYEQYKKMGIDVDGHGVGWTDISKFFPKTVRWLKQHCPLKEFDRIRVMILEPGGSSTPHRDAPSQFLCGPINIAVINPPGAEFALEGGGLVPWKEGDFRSMDLGSVHCVRNTGTMPRVHIIITPSKNDWDIDAKKLACDSFTKYLKDK